jgi:hypothetical protein
VGRGGSPLREGSPGGPPSALCAGSPRRGDLDSQAQPQRIERHHQNRTAVQSQSQYKFEMNRDLQSDLTDVDYSPSRIPVPTLYSSSLPPASSRSGRLLASSIALRRE